MMNCDAITGVCILDEMSEIEKKGSLKKKGKLLVRYLGDPMCSWCWGISPAINSLASWCDTSGIDFLITMGGLRAGGGDAWNEGFRDFLRNEWQHIASVTGQKFGMTLLESPSFNYDTEPACRAVTTLQLLSEPVVGVNAMKFFSLVQKKFYVEGKDPKEVEFYEEVCSFFGINWDEFRLVFESENARCAVQAEFMLCRQRGVRSFPTLLIEDDRGLRNLSVGYTTTEKLMKSLQDELANMEAV